MKDQSYRFVKKKHSKGGKASCGLAAFSCGLLAAAALISWIMGGNAGAVIGGLALIGALLAVYGFAVGMGSFRENDVSPAFSVAGSIACGVVLVVYLTLFVAGIR